MARTVDHISERPAHPRHRVGLVRARLRRVRLRVRHRRRAARRPRRATCRVIKRPVGAAQPAADPRHPDPHRRRRRAEDAADRRRARGREHERRRQEPYCSGPQRHPAPASCHEQLNTHLATTPHLHPTPECSQPPGRPARHELWMRSVWRRLPVARCPASPARPGRRAARRTPPRRPVQAPPPPTRKRSGSTTSATPVRPCSSTQVPASCSWPSQRPGRHADPP